MRSILNYILLITGLTAIATACQKVEDLPHYEKGNAVNLTASTAAVVPAAADSTKNVVTFSWTTPDYATDSSTYKFIVEIDSAGRNFSKETTRIITGGLSTSLTGRELNAIVLNYGFTLGTPYDMEVRVTSSYANNNERYFSNVVKLSVTPYSDPATLTSGNTSVTCALATASELSNTFSWSPSFTGYSGTVDYVLQYDSATKNFASPKDIPVGIALTSKKMTEGEMNETALQSGIPGGNSGKVEYRIKATTIQGAISYSNAVAVTVQSYVPILRFYLPGSYQTATGNGTDWTPGNAPELIRDLRSAVFNDMYYTYIYLPAGAKFKVTQGRSWDVNYGGTGGDLSAGGADLGVTTAGVYRVSINRKTMKYDIRQGRMGFVGGGTGAGWNPPNVFPAYAMGAPATNLFVGLTNLTTDGWKLIDNDQWNNGSNAVDETRSYGTKSATGSTLEVNGADFNGPAAPGRYRVIWDGRDVNNIKYEISPATEMRVVGDGMESVPDWNPGASPQMTYSGNGVWTITIALKAGKSIKFLAGNDWGAFDYEDAGSGKIKWEGGGDFKTPAAAGTYTITLNEHTQTVTIN